ncbi:MAG: histidine phosphatase family protein [Clostridia bacterium]|nr:histidine phosphatase family protein [Clostridia bacterium]
MLLFYVRHGDPIYNPDSLTPLGHLQADAVAKRLARYGIDEIYASSSNRARLTAKPTCDILGKEATILDWCNEGHAWLQLTEMDSGGNREWCFAKQKYIEAFCSNEVKALGENWHTHPAFEGTTLGEGIERIKRETYAFLKELGFEYDETKGMYKSSKQGNKRIALFAHQGFGLAFLSAVSLIPYPSFSTRFDMTHTGVTVINFPEKDGYVMPKILTLANDSHIYNEGLPTKYNGSIYF